MSACSAAVDGVVFGSLTPTKKCPMYPAVQATIDAASFGNGMRHHLFSHGGFIYKSEDNTILGVMTYSAMSGTLHQDSSHIMTFSTPVDVTTVAEPCGSTEVFQDCPSGMNVCPREASKFCWTDADQLIVKWSDAATSDHVMQYALVDTSTLTTNPVPAPAPTPVGDSNLPVITDQAE